MAIDWTTVRLYLIVVAISFGTKVQMMTEGAMNTMEFVSENWMYSCYPGLPDETSMVLEGITRGLFHAGCALGSIATNFLPDIIGRRRSLLGTFLGMALMLVGNFFSIQFNSVPMFVVTRTFVGIFYGYGTSVATMFCSEIGTKDNRGRTVSLLHACAGIGDITGMLVGVPAVLGTPHHWSYVFLLAAGLAFLPFPIVYCCPESPRYLAITKGEPERARRALAYFLPRNVDESLDALVDGELDAMQREINQAKAASKIGLGHLACYESYRKSFVLALVVSVSTVLSGHVAIYSYSTELWVSAGIQRSTAQIATVYMAVASPLAAAFGPLVVDRLGRKPLLLGGLIITAFALILFSVSSTFYQRDRVEIALVGSLASMIVHIAGFNIAQTARWTLPGELLPQSARSSGVAFGDALYRIIAFLSAFLFLPWRREVGTTIAFLPFLVLTALCWFYLFIRLPETKGKSIEDIVDQMGFFNRPRARMISSAPNLREKLEVRPTYGTSKVFPARLRDPIMKAIEPYLP